MKLFIDTANVEEIREIGEWGILEGVTTNPSLIAKEGLKLEDVMKEIVEIVEGPISAEVMGLKADEMLVEGRALSEIHPNIVIKVPFCEEGLKAIKKFHEENIKTNCTLIFSPAQALLAAKAGATFVSPFLGRLDDIGHVGMDLIESIKKIFVKGNISTEIISASIRGPQHVIQAAEAGSDIATVPYKVFKQMLNHPLTENGIEQFIRDYEGMKG
ncbi:fructose-6-phosphate aldolase [Peptoniphilus sp. KCTC 25270]|uniref:fructose-6-phosphate aldolase n=1 Tax=Peptoniphilus sp. KCTC 25270 TaxID=2897414 RepID=UPI001E4958B5|nr:fructose-6-phosphate aldolase [Peptoniphilus sp. KCTC 25270]MCD1147021.1 fructose-6-phosphate aldolase [Peptoniphilus sp. KCTC 25270]